MAGDDAFGPLVADHLRTRTHVDADVLDLGMKPLALLNHLAGRSALIVVDAALPGGDFPSGRLIDLEYSRRACPQLLHDASLSSHGLSLADELELAREVEMLPEQVFVVAAAISNAIIGQPPSDQIRRLVQPAAERINQLAEHCLARR